MSPPPQHPTRLLFHCPSLRCTGTEMPLCVSFPSFFFPSSHFYDCRCSSSVLEQPINGQILQELCISVATHTFLKNYKGVKITGIDETFWTLHNIWRFFFFTVGLSLIAFSFLFFFFYLNWLFQDIASFCWCDKQQRHATPLQYSWYVAPLWEPVHQCGSATACYKLLWSWLGFFFLL